ncbi:MAG: hypothetical protein KAH44_28310 [Oricola sp.]|nr:hypothetical protein [Oricola sp.]
MSKLDDLFGRYRRQADLVPDEPVESKVQAKIRIARQNSVQAIIALPSFRPTAIAAGLLIGLLSTTHIQSVTNERAMLPELDVFAPQSTYLLASSIGLTE